MTALLKVAQRRSRERRRRILDAATRLFGAQGIDRTSLTEVARAAGVPLSSLYDYFRDRQSLVAAVPERNFEELYALLAAEPAESGAIERLRRLYLGTFDYIAANPEWGRVFFLEIWPGVVAAEPTVRRAVDDYAGRFVAIIRAGIAAGEMRADLAPHLAMSLLMGAMSQLAAVWLLYDRPFDLRTKGAAAFETLLCAYAPPKCRPSRATASSRTASCLAKQKRA